MQVHPSHQHHYTSLFPFWDFRPVILDPADPTGNVGTGYRWDLVAEEASDCSQQLCCTTFGGDPVAYWDVPVRRNGFCHQISGEPSPRWDGGVCVWGWSFGLQSWEVGCSVDPLSSPCQPPPAPYMHFDITPSNHAPLHTFPVLSGPAAHQLLASFATYPGCLCGR